MEGFIGEIRIFAGNFAPRSWAFCEGQLLAISQNNALFSILGTTYGGDGRTTFALPDLRGRVPVGFGNGPGLTDRRLGAKGGTEQNTLNATQIPSHNHNVAVLTANTATSASPENAFPAPISGRATTTPPANMQATGYGTGTDLNMGAGTVTFGNTGGNQPLENRQPYIPIYYIIALFGTYPSRS
jgi:microcystin-dependent protein